MSTPAPLFQTEMVATVHLVRLPAHLDKIAVEEFSRVCHEWEKIPAKLHVLDAAGCTQISPLFYRVITQFKKTIATRGAVLISIHLSHQLAAQIEQAGMDPVFSPYTSLKDALQKSGLLSGQSGVPEINDAFLQPVIAGVSAAFQMLAGQPVKLQASSKALHDPDDLGIDVGAAIDIFNKASRGRVAIYFSGAALLTLFEKATQKPYDPSHAAQSQDLVREVLNMTVGKAKGEWSGKGYNFDRTLPQTLLGEKLREQIHEFLPRAVVVPLDAPGGAIYIGVSITAL